MLKYSKAALIASGMALAAASAFAADGVPFTVTIKNINANQPIVLPNGDKTDAPIAPGVWAVGTKSDLVFAVGQSASRELERLAEDGNFEPLQYEVAKRKGLAGSGMFFPGQTFSFMAKSGDLLGFATMFVQSNDLFFAPKGGSLSLFDGNGKPISGNLTASVELYDAGTEINQAPGVGSDQAPRQVKADTGAAEKMPVSPITTRKDGFVYPAVSAVIELEILPMSVQRFGGAKLFKPYKVPG